MQEVPDISESETWVICTTLKERYSEDVDLQFADSVTRLRPSDRELTACPVWYWMHRGCNFVIFKTGTRKYRCQFFYRSKQQFGTRVKGYNDVTECVVSLLQTQVDHVAKDRGDL